MLGEIISNFMSTNYIMKAQTLHISLTPSLFIKYAKDGFEAAQFFKNKKYFSPVPYYLYCRSIELSLKAFLLHNSKKLDELKSRKYGHNLGKILEEAKKYNLSKLLNVTSLEENELQKASALYDNPNKAFEYSRVIDAVHGYNNFPKLKIIKRLAKKLLKIKNSI